MSLLASVPHLLGSGLGMAFSMFWETLWPLVIGFAVSGAVQAFVRPDELKGTLGDHRPRTVALAALLGAVSSSCSYAASAVAKSLFQKGADLVTAIVFMLASTNLVLELGLVLWILLGWQFVLAQYVGGAVMIALLALGARFLFRPRLISTARRRVDARSGRRAAEPTAPPVRLAQRLRSRAGWSAAAGYAVSDLRMVARELVAGYLVAGFLAALVPPTVWSAVFFTGHGVWTALENVLIGPLIAILSFTCSVGNVPLAAALWAGGLSFGGVVSFLLADLLTMPLLLIYRRYYGTPLALRILGGLWIVMSAAALLVDGTFHLLHVVPPRIPSAVTVALPGENLTTLLNVVALAGLGLLVWVARQRGRWGDQRYAVDPVCGMQVSRRQAPAAAQYGGDRYFFCSDRCCERFLSSRQAGPQRLPAHAAATTGRHQAQGR